VVLVAALAAGCYLARTSFYETIPLLKHRSAFRFPLVFRVVHDVFAAFVAALSAAMIILRLRRPRPRLPDVLQQPGFLGCFVGTLVFGTCIVSMASEQPLSSVLFMASIANAYSIVAAWFAILLAGFWYPEPGWIDRMARILCLFWLGAPFLLSLGLAI